MSRSTRGVLILAAVILAVGLISCLPGSVMGSWMDHDTWGHGRSWWPHGFRVGGLATIAIWAAVVGGLYLLSRHGRPEGSPGASPASPVDIIKRRYAEGQITREQFEQMKTDLEG